MTWAFAYLACLLVGLVLGAVSGLLGDLKALVQSQPVAPATNHRPVLLNLVWRRVAAGLAAFGLVGLILASRGPSHQRNALIGAISAGIATELFSLLVLRRRSQRQPASLVAVVVREIAAGGFGQIHILGASGDVLMAARSDDSVAIPAGSEVEIVDTQRSVVMVRRVKA
jgi:hypothetical protein